MMEYLRADKLHLGDVLLVKSRGKPSNLIAKATGGPYSHAAIYAGNLRLFEALTTGVAYTQLILKKVEVHDDGTSRQFCDVSSYDRVDVFRLPDTTWPKDYGTYGFGSRFSQILWDYNGLDYSKLHRLAEASAVGRANPRLASLIMRVFGAALCDTAKNLPGPFCSELVIDALSQAGFTILSKERQSHTVSPADLSNPEITKLVQIENCFDAVDPKIPNDVEKMGQLTAIQWTPTKRVHDLRELAQRIDDFGNQSRKV